MKPYQELTPKTKIIRMTAARVILYGALLLALYYACAKLYKTVNKVRTPVMRDKNLPIASTSFIPFIFYHSALLQAEKNEQRIGCPL